MTTKKNRKNEKEILETERLTRVEKDIQARAERDGNAKAAREKEILETERLTRVEEETAHKIATGKIARDTTPAAEAAEAPPPASPSAAEAAATAPAKPVVASAEKAAATAPAKPVVASAEKAAAPAPAKPVVAPLSDTITRLQDVYDTADKLLKAYFNSKRAENIIGTAVDINQKDNSKSLGFSVYPENGIIISFQPQSQVRAKILFQTHS